MGMTMTQKILARAAGLPQVEAGQLIEGKLDLVLGNDITTPVAITEFNKAILSRSNTEDSPALPRRALRRPLPKCLQSKPLRRG